ncbi:MAG TPA: hypothetical protein VD772_09160, partial [Anseongella sp.]|nr:hypothetical protein [Anseongella sp.]
DGFSLYPAVRIADCKGFAGYFGDIIAELQFDGCTLSRLTAGGSGPFRGAISFSDCRFRPEVSEDQLPFYRLAAVSGTRFTNCTIHAPLVNGQSRPGKTDLMDFVQLNKAVRYNHLNTVLGRDILAYCRKEGIELKPGFIAMLKSHHELEPENL